jgi:hypothetical protein
MISIRQRVAVGNFRLSDPTPSEAYHAIHWRSVTYFTVQREAYSMSPLVPIATCGPMIVVGRFRGKADSPKLSAWAIVSSRAIDARWPRQPANAPRVYRGWMLSRTVRSRVSAALQPPPALAMPIICTKPPVPKRSHCATMMSSPLFMSLACATV